MRERDSSPQLFILVFDVTYERSKNTRSLTQLGTEFLEAARGVVLYVTRPFDRHRRDVAVLAERWQSKEDVHARHRPIALG